MKSISQEIANFAVETRFEDLPREVVHESKRILLDCIGCALAALGTDKGKIAVKMARQLGGSGEASVIGVGEKSSYSGAAFANSELIITLDYEVACGGHVPTLVVAAPLALADTTVGDIYHATLPFAAVKALSIVIVIAFPVLATWLLGLIIAR